MGANLSNGGRGRGYRKNSFTEINITPFVDVMLVLLVIFMVTAPMMTLGVAVDLPESKAAPIKEKTEPLTISIKGNKSIYIEKSKIPLHKLGQKLKNIIGEKLDTRIFVRGDKDVDYGYVMKVIGEVNAAGLKKVALITTQETTKSRRRRR